MVFREEHHFSTAKSALKAFGINDLRMLLDADDL
jgi:hypothetical protein